MRAFRWIVAAVLVATGIGLGALAAGGHTSSGITNLSPRAAARAAVDSLSSTPYLQIALKVAVPGSPASDGLGNLAVDLSFASTSSSEDLHDAKAVNESVSVLDGTKVIAAVRVVGGKTYLSVDLASLGSLGGGALGGGAGVIRMLLDGRWIELPAGALGPWTSQPGLGAGSSEEILHALGRATTFSNGQAAGPNRVIIASGSARTVLSALPADIRALLAAAARRAGSGGGAALGKVAGRYRISLEVSPAGVLMSTSVQLGSTSIDATVGHVASSVLAPSQATPLSLGLLRSLLGGIGIRSGLGGPTI